MSIDDWARAHGGALFSASIRNQPEHFVVNEFLGFEFSDSGEHDLLRVRKISANTEWVARELARFAGISVRDVGFCGLKDRHAVTEQWFSVPRWHSPQWQDFRADDASIVDVQRHHRKLRRGAHKQNAFRLVLKGTVESSAVEAIDGRLKDLRDKGVPNYFGNQRFGRAGANIDLVERWCAGKRVPRKSRAFAISAARAYLFNRQLQARVVNGTWDQLIAGDSANLDGSGSVFAIKEFDTELENRARALDIHPAGELFGDGSARELMPDGYTHWLDALENARVKPMYRALRLRVESLQWALSGDQVELEFSLRRGSYATAVLRELAAITDSKS